LITHRELIHKEIECLFECKEAVCGSHG